MPLDFGIEIECLIPGLSSATLSAVATGLATAITSAGVGCYYAGYSHARTGQWKIVTDSSVSPPAGYVGLEIVSPPLGEEGLAQIEIVGNTLIAMGARVNKSCGLHVHIGARSLSIPAMKQLAWLYHDYEESIDSLLPPSRRGNGNTYCRSVKMTVDREALKRARDITQIQRAISGGSRYVKLNIGAFWKHGTVEFRQHSGTVDPVKMTKWVLFCTQMVDTAKRTETESTRQTAASIDPILARSLARAKSRRVIYQAACRPEGVTREEAQMLTATDRPPSIRTAMCNLGVGDRLYRDGRRDGHSIYKIRQVMLPSGVPTDTSLPAMLAKLNLPPEDVQFWSERTALLSGTMNSNEDEAA
jgi:Putative amidoligase enzyme